MASRLFVAALALLLSGCVVPAPHDLFKLGESISQLRSQESRRFDGANKEQIYSASAGVLQDLGFTLSETQAGLGLLVGTKDRSAVSGGQVAAAIFVALLGGQPAPLDKNQKFFASVVVNEVLGDAGVVVPGQYVVRATFSRKVWNTQDQLTRAEQLRDLELYTGFFDKLSKAVFLEAHSI